LILQKQIYNLLPFDEAALHDALFRRLKWGSIGGCKSLPYGPLLLMVVKPVGADTVRLSSGVESLSMPLLMSGSIPGISFVGLGDFAVETTVLESKVIVLVDTEAVPWRASPSK
jgi:hypothetical protein